MVVLSDTLNLKPLGMLGGAVNHFRRGKYLAAKLTIQFKCKDFLLKECEFEIKGAHSVDEIMKLVDVHVTKAHRTLKVSPETREKIRRSIRE